MDYLAQPLLNDKDGEFFFSISNTHGADPVPWKRFISISHEPSPRCCRVNRETIVCLANLANNREAYLNMTARWIVQKYDIWGGYLGDYVFKVAGGNDVLIYLGEKVEPIVLSETAEPAEVE